jgi:hypothetical protein
MARLTARKQPAVVRRRKRTRPILPAAERGYGPEHRAARAAAIARFRPGQLCPRCLKPIAALWMTDRRGRTVSAVDLGHVDGSGKTAYQGLEHRRCSRSAGASLGNRQRGDARHPERAPWRSARQW